MGFMGRMKGEEEEKRARSRELWKCGGEQETMRIVMGKLVKGQRGKEMKDILIVGIIMCLVRKLALVKSPIIHKDDPS